MSNDISPSEQDAEWLKSRMPDATSDEIEMFCEKVGVCWMDGGMDIDRARDSALKEVLRRRDEHR